MSGYEQQADQAARSGADEPAREQLSGDAKFWKDAYTGSVEVGRKTRQALEDVLALTEPWPLRDAVAKLIEGTTHLLRDHGCDRHRHEELAAAMHTAERLLPKIDDAQRVLLETRKA